MNILDKCVQVLNHRLFTSQLTDACFQSNNIYSLAYQSLPTNDSPARPFYYRQNDPIFVDLNDSKNITVYHRMLNVNMVENPNAGWGNGDGVTIADFQMLMIVYCNRKNISYSTEDMILKICSNLNYTFESSAVSVAGLRFVRSSVQRANPNALQVFTGEYGATANCPLQFDSSYFGINYQIEIHATNECLTCTTC